MGFITKIIFLALLACGTVFGASTHGHKGSHGGSSPQPPTSGSSPPTFESSPLPPNVGSSEAPLPPTSGSDVKCADGSTALPSFNGQPKPCTGGNREDVGYAGCPFGYECVISTGTNGICCSKAGSAPVTSGVTVTAMPESPEESTVSPTMLPGPPGYGPESTQPPAKPSSYPGFGGDENKPAKHPNQGVDPNAEIPNGKSHGSHSDNSSSSISLAQSAGPAVPNSVRVPCVKNADCYGFREPSEWCQKDNSFMWTDKGCFCAYDNQLLSCIIERIDTATKAYQWTYCAPKEQFKC